ncbi:M20 family metallopeptidase [Streptomyces olivochromogenes]|uniref:M20 family metallopeptidase n=1 Tax=Streptomyces olivochromogenes TaxID=1963 RepID=UPI0036DF67CA
MELKQRVSERLDTAHASLVRLSHAMHEHPEPGFEEHMASAWLSELLTEAGFSVERGVCDLPTAFVATYGSGPLHIAFDAEYDCLPGIGHACGHNVIAATSAGAAIAAAAVADELGLTVKVIGTPAQELGGGKILMLERGAFDGVHAVLMAHPGPMDVAETVTLAMSHFDVEYRGRESHASMFPENGLNALDALTTAQVSLGLLRQQMRSTDRVHGVVRHGGDAPHVIPHQVTAEYMVRAADMGELHALEARVRDCFQAGALASGTSVKLRPYHPPYAEQRQDAELLALYKANAIAVGRTFPDLDPSLVRRAAGASDFGNVSHVIPAIQPSLGLDSFPAVPHQADFAAHTVTPVADRAIREGAAALAGTAVDAALVPGLRARLTAASFSSAAARAAAR